jgi:hypothetical protein
MLRYLVYLATSYRAYVRCVLLQPTILLESVRNQYLTNRIMRQIYTIKLRQKYLMVSKEVKRVEAVSINIQPNYILSSVYPNAAYVISHCGVRGIGPGCTTGSEKPRRKPLIPLQLWVEFYI